MSKVTSQMTIMDVLSLDRGTASIFMQHGLHCLGCPHATSESIEEASMVHGIDAEDLIVDLNNFLDAKTQG